MISDIAIEDAVEEFIITELRVALKKHLDAAIEDVLVKAMQEIVIKLYRNDKMTGINFNIEVKPRDGKD